MLPKIDTTRRFDRLQALGLVRMEVEPDEHTTIDDLEGDTYNQAVHPDIPAEQIERERQEFHDRVNREGVYGIVGQYKLQGRWVHADSVWGFVGNDYKGSGYDLDVMAQTIDAFRTAISSRCRCCKGTGKAKV